MNLSKFVGTATAVLVAILCSFSTVNAISNNIIAENNPTPLAQISASVDGGPRTVIQFMTDVTVVQPESTTLSLTVVKPSGEVLLELTSEELQTKISTEGWAAGEYIIETTDEDQSYQEFVVEVD